MSEKMSVYISVDMEGVAPVVDVREIKQGNSEYDRACELMTEEANAAVEGAFEGGADRVVVRDAHGTARNILPGELDSRAELIRGWSGQPCGMMDGIDEDFDLVFLIGYHAGAGSRDAVIRHTYSGKFNAMTIDGHTINEAILNSLFASSFGVDVALISGDERTCQQTRELIPEIETAPVKSGLGEGVQSLSPERARELIEERARAALKSSSRTGGVSLDPPYEIQLVFAEMENAIRAGNYPGAERDSSYAVSFTARDIEELMTFIDFVK